MNRNQASAAHTTILQDADRKVREYDWLGAADLYGEALKSEGEQDSMVKLLELRGYSFMKASFQSKDADEFVARIRRALDEYAIALRVYEKSNVGDGVSPDALRCQAIIAYLNFWLSPDSASISLLRESWKLTIQALTEFKKIGASENYTRTYNGLWQIGARRLEFEADYNECVKMVMEAVEHGRQATRILSIVNSQPKELAKAHMNLGLFLSGSLLYVDIESQERFEKEAAD